MSEPSSNYFKVGLGGVPHRENFFPFIDGDPASTQDAWNAAVASGPDRVLAWKMPRCSGPWTDCAIVGEVGLTVEQMRAGFRRQLPHPWKPELPS